MDGQRPSTSIPTIGPREVHVYDVGLELDAIDVEKLAKVLDERELATAARFATVSLRRKYVASHARLRSVLSRYLNLAPTEVRFLHGEQGKPWLDPCHRSNVRFNLSHSGEKGLVAITTNREVGIDVELIRPLEDWREIAERFFSQRETVRLSSLPPHLVERAFFATWSRKEAYVKALGLGLALDLGAFEVEVDPRNEARLEWTLDDLEGPTKWSLRDIHVGPEYHAAIAIEGQDCVLSVQPNDWL
jgi:4'-phosphopantetheinyl transferase